MEQLNTSYECATESDHELNEAEYCAYILWNILYFKLFGEIQSR